MGPSPLARRALRKFAGQGGDSVGTVLEKVTGGSGSSKRRTPFFAALRANPEEWRDELEERQAWAATLEDGLDDEGESRL